MFSNFLLGSSFIRSERDISLSSMSEYNVGRIIFHSEERFIEMRNALFICEQGKHEKWFQTHDTSKYYEFVREHPRTFLAFATKAMGPERVQRYVARYIDITSKPGRKARVGSKEKAVKRARTAEVPAKKTPKKFTNKDEVQLKESRRRYLKAKRRYQGATGIIQTKYKGALPPTGDPERGNDRLRYDSARKDFNHAESEFNRLQINMLQRKPGSEPLSVKRRKFRIRHL